MNIAIVTPTHDPAWLAATWKSLERQTDRDWTWFVFFSGKATGSSILDVVGADNERVRIYAMPDDKKGIGAIKRHAFMKAAETHDVLVELDHDDLLSPDAIAEIRAAFEREKDAGFVYSDFVDFKHGDPTLPVTYRSNLAAWVADGWQFYDTEISPESYALMTGKDLAAGEEATHRRMLAAKAWDPTSASLGLIYWAPNHVRAWRSAAYKAAGGHDEKFEICDDHELLIRTYKVTRMFRIPKPLYYYRVTGHNTWEPRQDEIRKITYALQAQHLPGLVLRECELRGLPAYDLGGAHGCPAGWTPVDCEMPEGKGINADLNFHWPFADGSVGAFRAFDFLEHLPDKQFVMGEIHRCLAPGGWLLSQTPSTDGRGAWQDPTHVSFWNENSFWYWTKRELAKYIRNDAIRFQAHRLFSGFPSSFHEKHVISYVTADLVKLSPERPNPPGAISI